MRENRRDAERLPILGGLQGEVKVFQPMQIKEIGRGGVSVETSFPLHLNSLHEMRLTLDDTSVVVKGRVTHAHISDVEQDVVTYWSGLEFVEPSEQVLDTIEHFLTRVKARRQGLESP